MLSEVFVQDGGERAFSTKRVEDEEKDCATPVGQEGLRTVGYALRSTYLALSRALLRQRKTMAIDLTVPQWYFMREIWQEEGLSQRELSARVGLSEPTTVSALRVLERRGLIRKLSKQPGDRRTLRIYLTEQGRAFRQEAMPLIMHVNAAAVEGLQPEDIEALLQALERIRDNLRAIGDR